MSQKAKAISYLLISSIQFENNISTVNKFFRFNDLYTEAEKFYEIKAYLTCLAYLNEALSFGIPLPNNRLSEAFEFRGLIKMQLSQYLASIIDFNKAIELNPENGSIYYYRYLAHSVLSQYEEAIEDCKKLIALEPDNESHQKDLNSLEEIFRLNQRFKNLKE